MAAPQPAKTERVSEQMSDMDQEDNNDIVLAGEYALRLLDKEAEAAFEARLRDEPALRALVAGWDEDLISLSDTIDPVTPPLGLKLEIENRLFAGEKTGKRRSTFWGFFGSALAAAVVLDVVYVAQPDLFQTNPGPVFVAEMVAEGTDVIVSARFDADAGALQLERIAGQEQSGRSFELWLIAEGADAPISLGVLAADSTSAITIPETLIADFQGGTLAITDEPFGGSPSGLPTGEIVAAGTITLL